MTKDDLFCALASTGLPYAAETWWPDKPPPLPYVLACAQDARASHADNRNLVRTTTYRLELYCHGRDRAAEEALAGALDSAGLAYGVAFGGLVDGTDVYMTALTATVTGD